MSTAAPLLNTATQAAPVNNLSHTGLLLQKKCACGAPKSSLTGVCEECKGKTRFQAKLSIGASNDPLEIEADRVAEQVLAAPANPAVSAAPPRIQRFTGHTPADTGTAPASVERAIASSGMPLDPPLRQDMGQRFGHDFSQVRIHTGTAAEQSARDVHAHAYTVGNDIVFGRGKFSQISQDGKKLIAHELTHVVQQGKGTATHAVQRSWDWAGAGIGALVGGAGGALLGGLIGGPVGALVGAGIGALAGGLIGGLAGAGSDQLDRANARYSNRRYYAYNQQDATGLYKLAVAPDLVPASGFVRQNTALVDYTSRWRDGLGMNRLNLLGGDCGMYARQLISLTGRAPESYATNRPGIGLAPANDLQPGEAYYIHPAGGGATQAVEEDVLSPWNNTETVRKHLTNFHVATVVAKDNSTVVTSEVNAAFPGHVTPWFAMYQGNNGFYRTYRREYRAGGVDPGLSRM